MKVLIDTNILISAALNSKGTPYLAFVKAVSYPNHGIICEQNIDEMRRIFNRKFPNKIHALETFLSLAMLTLKVVPTPTEEEIAEEIAKLAEQYNMEADKIKAAVPQEQLTDDIVTRKAVDFVVDNSVKE